MKGMDQPAMSKGSDMKAMDQKSMQGTSGATHIATGTVKSVDSKNETVTLDHGPVPSLNWPAMTMTFKVKDKAVLNDFAVNQKVEFEFQQLSKDNVITEVK